MSVWLASLRMLSIRRMILLVSLSVILSIVVTSAILIRTVNRRISETVSAFALQQFKLEGGKRCQDAPGQWDLLLSNGTRIYAYDVSTFQSANPRAPAFPRRLRDTVKAGAGRAYSRWPLLFGGSTHVVKVATSGPCSLVMMRWTLTYAQRLGALALLAGVFLMGLLLCLFLSFFSIARPLFLRIQQIAQLAKAVGQESLATGWTKTQDDDLGAIERSLQQAHERILEDTRMLEAKHRALHQHIANVAHDLRTPITSLQLVLERASQRRETHPHEEIAAAMADAVYLEQLTNNLSLATQLEEQLWTSAQCRALELGELVRRVAARFRVLAAERGIAMEYAYPDQTLVAMGDALLLERALCNLVFNAIRYNQEGGHVALLLEQQDTRFVCKVMDDGPGVPPTEIPRLNLRHFRSDEARQRDATGQGLGLAITSEVCLRLGYTLAFSRLSPHGLCAEISGDLTTP